MEIEMSDCDQYTLTYSDGEEMICSGQFVEWYLRKFPELIESVVAR